MAGIPDYKIFHILKMKQAHLKAIAPRKGAKLVLEPQTGIRELWGTRVDANELSNFVEEEAYEEEYIFGRHKRKHCDHGET